MLEPIIDALVKPPEGVGGGPTFARNASMLLVVLCISPLTTWRDMTALQNVGAASMASVLIVGLCVAYRSIECQLGVGGSLETADTNVDNLRAFPPSMKELLDAAPLFISSYICHFNVIPIHNELRCPTSDRVRKWVRTSIWPATLFYYIIGFTGSLFAKCTSSGTVQGNILLDFDEDDPLLLIGRLCLAMTITLAFPMLVIPCRDILVRSMLGTRFGRRVLKSLPKSRRAFGVPSDIAIPEGLTTVEFEPMELEEPLLVLENSVASGALPADELGEESYESFVENTSLPSRQFAGGVDSKPARILVALFVFWSAAAFACSVRSIDVVWDLLGSSFSIMMAFLIPCGAFLKLAGRKRFNESQDGGAGFRRWLVSRAVAWIMILLFLPLMVISTLNACYNSFFSN
jgi:amino acid permease